jgi:hypothetical protein
MERGEVGAALVGAWLLQGWEIRFSDGRPSAWPFGEDATGLLVYSAEGWMNATIAAAGRKPLSESSVRQAPVAEQCEAFASYFNYAGRFRVRVVDDVPYVLHVVEHSLNPAFVGSEQLRRAEFDGLDRLTLCAEERTGSVIRMHRLAWQRVST